MMTTMGSDYFPKSTEGRLTALLLAVYAFAIFGYITATVASAIIQYQPAASIAGGGSVETKRDAEQLRLVVTELQDDINRLKEMLARHAE